jgi:hypothetical protein
MGNNEMNLVAKPIIKNQFWVVTDGDKKVGNVESQGSGFDVKIGNNIEHYDSKKAIEKIKHIEFEKAIKAKVEVTAPSFSVFPTTSNRIYNSVLDVKRKLHLFTKTPKSKCFHVAGWFALKQSSDYTVVFCPKYIFVQRYDYLGPFKSEKEANSSINSL